jgi:hypothetical protein
LAIAVAFHFRIVGNPYLTGLGKSSPSLGPNPEILPLTAREDVTPLRADSAHSPRR